MPLDLDDLPLVGGHPILDLVNTVERGGSPDAHDWLADPAALLRWSVRAGLVTEAERPAVARAWRDEPGSAAAASSAAHQLREAVHTVALGLLGAAGPAPTAALEVLHSRWAVAVGRGRLVFDPAGPRVSLAVGPLPATLVTDRLADAAVELLRTVDPGRLRRCPPDEGGCGWLMLDHTRNGSRRWCRMADCGTQVKARRLTERRRAARLPANSD
jgi:predicted RNA-binding Zn ribbon-like protein